VPGKPPYFPFYVNDFAADGVVECMTTEQVGAYALILCKAWYQEPPGTVPADDATLSRWSRLTPERWSEIKAGVLAAFRAGEDGRLHQKRMKEEYAKLMRLLKARSLGGRKGAKNRWRNLDDSASGAPNAAPKHRPIDEPKQCQNGLEVTRASDSESNSESTLQGLGGAGGPGVRTRRPKRAGSADGFDDFWMAYPRKTAKADARKAWAKLAPAAELRAVMLAALEVQKHSADWRKEGGKYVPHPATWLNGERWEDEPQADAASEDPKRDEEEPRITRSKVTPELCAEMGWPYPLPAAPPEGSPP
jgi:uncharacterized protein YdaU (DUF1376 family)